MEAGTLFREDGGLPGFIRGEDVNSNKIRRPQCYPMSTNQENVQPFIHVPQSWLILTLSELACYVVDAE